MTKVIKFLVAAILSVGLLGGCASMATPTTPKEQIYAGVKQAEALANTAHRLHDSEVITTDDYAEVLKDIRDANETLGNARALLEAGDEMAAEDRVRVANTILLSVRSALKDYQRENKANPANSEGGKLNE